MARRTRSEMIAALKAAEDQKRARRIALEAKEKQASRKADTRRKILAGTAVLAHAAQDAAFAGWLRGLLEKAITKPSDRDLLVNLFEPPAPPAPPVVVDASPPPEQPPPEEPPPPQQGW